VGKAGCELALDPAAVDIKRFEDFEHFLHVYRAVNRPIQDIEILSARFQLPQDLVDQGRFLERPLEEPEVVMVELNPKIPAL